MKQDIAKLDWVPSSPDFSPTARIWTLMKRSMQGRRASERVTTIAEMKLVLCEKIAVDEINREIETLPTMILSLAALL